jgi:hypothetical protein
MDKNLHKMQGITDENTKDRITKKRSQRKSKESDQKRRETIIIKKNKEDRKRIQ